MDNNGLTTGDLALMRNNGFDGDNGFVWIFGLLMMMGMMNGGWGVNNNWHQNLATQNDVQRGFDTAALADQSRDILAAVSGGTAQSVAATNQAKYDNINVMKDVQAALTGQIADVRMMEQNILGKQAECCCDIKQMIEQSKYEQAMALAGFELRLNSKLDQNEITNLRDQIQNLRLDQATSGMLRFPNTWSYGAGPFPPVFGPSCGGNM